MSNANPLVDISTSVWETWNSYQAKTQNYPAGGFIFPSELSGANRPVLKISCNQLRSNFFSNRPIIFLPAPGGLSFENASTYDDTDLGIQGAAALGAIRGAKAENLGTKIQEATKNLGETSLLDFLGAGIRGQAGDSSDQVKSAIGIGAKSTLNKNYTTEFTGVNTRSFSFAYKLVPTSKAESDTIKGIIGALTVGLYPEVTAGGAVLKYPPTWTIEILKTLGGGSARLESVPRIFECYLQSFTTNYNNSTNSYFSDGTPVEVDLNMTFKETRALSAQDISQLL